MIKDAIEKIEGLTTKGLTPISVKLRERLYTTRSLHPVHEPEAAGLALSSLRGLIDYIAEAQIAGLAEFPNGMALHIRGPRDVGLISWTFGDFRQRDHYARATPPTGDGFPFGKYLDVEEFVVRLLSQFAQTKHRDELVAVVGNVRAEAVQTIADDGVSQTATVKQGARLGDVRITNPVTLAPFRTFPEVEQPEVDFVIRLRGGGEGHLPTLALFEVDDGQWRKVAINHIEAYLIAEMEDRAIVPIII